MFEHVIFVGTYEIPNVAFDDFLTANRDMSGFVKRILRKYGYPPDNQGKATQTVLLNSIGRLHACWIRKNPTRAVAIPSAQDKARR